MSRTPAQVQLGLLRLVPSGFPFEGAGALNPDGYVAARLLAPAAELALVEESIEAMLPQVDMRLAFNLLPDYQRVLGPDPCGRDLQALPFAEQAGIAYAAWTAGGNLCAGYYETIALGVGTTVTVTECVCTECGIATCDTEMIPANENFVVQFGLQTDLLTDCECGVSTCDDSLGLVNANPAQCPITHSLPMHIIPVFNYTQAA